jgi:hypothetical protein
VLLRVDGRDLAAELLEALDDPDGGVPVTGVVSSGEARRARAQDHDVDDALSAHAIRMLTAAPSEPSVAAVAGFARRRPYGVRR